MPNLTGFLIELFFIGSGSFLWLSLFIYRILGFNEISEVIHFNINFESSVLIVFFITLSYVFGIVVDRFACGLIYFYGNKKFIKLVDKFKLDSIMKKDYPFFYKYLFRPGDKYNFVGFEKFIRTRCAALSDKLDYNGSRLIICRAWVIHLILIIIAVCVNSELFGSNKCLFIVFLLFMLGVLLGTTYLLLMDSLGDLCESVLILHDKKKSEHRCENM